MTLQEEEKPKRSPALQFIAGFASGIGAGLAMFVLTLLFSSMFNSLSSAFAVVWGVLSFALFGYLAYTTRDTRQSVFHAGLATAFAVIMLLDAACWGLLA